MGSLLFYGLIVVIAIGVLYTVVQSATLAALREFEEEKERKQKIVR